MENKFGIGLPRKIFTVKLTVNSKCIPSCINNGSSLPGQPSLQHPFYLQIHFLTDFSQNPKKFLSPIKHSLDDFGLFTSKVISSQSLRNDQEGTGKSQDTRGRSDFEGHGDETPLDIGHAATNRGAFYEEFGERPPPRRRQDLVISLEQQNNNNVTNMLILCR